MSIIRRSIFYIAKNLQNYVNSEFKICLSQEKNNYKKTIQQVTGENILNRKFDSDEFSNKWITDVNEMKYGGLSN